MLACCRWETIGCDNVNLPRKICNICMKVLEKSWIFAERVAQTQAQLNTHVVEIKTEIFISDGMDEVLDNDEQSMDYNEFNAYLPSDYERYYPHQKEIDEYLESLERKLHEPLHMKTGKKVRTEKLTEHLCETCGRHFSNKNNLLTHTHMHLMPTDRRKYFQCYICKATFSYKKSLLYHMPAHCGKPTKYRCNVCRLPFSRLDSLNRHKLIHSQTNPHECHICGKAFRTKYILKVISAVIIEFAFLNE